MKKRFAALVVLAGITVLVCALDHGVAQGPGDGGAVLKLPGLEPAPPKKPVAEPGVLGLWQNQGLAQQSVLPESPQGNYALSRLKPREGPDPNQDILVTPNVGPWMIFLNSYTGETSHIFARAMVTVLRSKYKLPAYVFNYGEEERKKEYERVKGIIERQKQFLKEHNLSTDAPVRISFVRIEEQCGILVGGYSSSEQARKAVDELKNLSKTMKPTDFVIKDRDGREYPLVDVQTFTKTDIDQKTGKELNTRKAGAYVNPFLHAFVVPNPTGKKEPVKQEDPYDLTVLRKLNAEEPFSLLKCPKPLTLAITEFTTPTVIQDQKSTGFMEMLGLGRSMIREDGAAHNAHNLAEVLRKTKLEAYVLHTKFSSVVTVGSFDSFDDPALLAMQNLLTSQLKMDASAANSERPVVIPFFKSPLPMKVPR